MNKIAVLIPAYNAEKIIGDCLASLNANGEPHDIVIVDDGSRTPLQDCIPAQPNLTILRLDQNRGISGAMNAGLEHILSKGYAYIARMDADDKAWPNRLALQRRHLDERPETILVGSWIRVVSETGKPRYFVNMPVGAAFISTCLFYNNCMMHPTWMFRSELVARGLRYQSRFDYAEDYAFLREAQKHGELANIPEYLLDYTLSSQGISRSRLMAQTRRCLAVQWHYANPWNLHSYLGIANTLLVGFGKSWLKSQVYRWLPQLSASRRGTASGAEPSAQIRVMEWRPLRGFVKRGMRPADKVS